MVNSSDERRAIEAKRRNVDALSTYANVTGVGVGYRVVQGHTTPEVCIRVYVTKKIPASELPPSDTLPRSIDGVPIDVIEAEFQVHYGGPLLTPAERTQRFPAVVVGGVSIGGLSVSAGTLGGTVFDRGTGRQLLLSNWHVLVGPGSSDPGALIAQPGVADGGTSADPIARLTRAALTNRVDAAVAEVTTDRYLLHWISGIGAIEKSGTAALGMRVRKSGRTTGLTIGVVSDVSADVTIGGYPGGSRSFVDQIIADSIDSSPVSLGGDSGSFVVDDEDRAVGLLFAGPRVGGAFLIANPIADVVSTLNIEVRRGLTGIDSDSVQLTTY